MKWVIVIQWILFVNWKKNLCVITWINGKTFIFNERNFSQKATHCVLSFYMISRICKYIEKIDQWLARTGLNQYRKANSGYEVCFEFVKIFYIHIVVIAMHLCKYANKIEFCVLNGWCLISVWHFSMIIFMKIILKLTF